MVACLCRCSLAGCTPSGREVTACVNRPGTGSAPDKGVATDTGSFCSAVSPCLPFSSCRSSSLLRCRSVPRAFLFFHQTGFSLRWYAEMLNGVKWRNALMNSLVVGTGASAIATTLGLLAAWGLSESKPRVVSFVTAWLLLPMAVPIVIVAVACFITYSRFGLAGSRLGLIIAHAALGLPFVVITVSATLKGFNRNLSRAAQSLGASPAQAFRTITVPAVMPGILTGALFAFAISFDEVVVALFLSVPSSIHCPSKSSQGRAKASHQL